MSEREVVARAICAETCAFYGEPSCWRMAAADGEVWTGCDDPGCHALADAAIAAMGEREVTCSEALRPFAQALERYRFGPNDLIALVDDDSGRRLNVLHVDAFTAARDAIRALTEKETTT